jgi:7,8-dihydroneopterin aldolase/epimerase/oxygenase
VAAEPLPLNRAEPLRRRALTVFVKGLRLQAEIGLYPHEKGRTQALVIDVELQLGDQAVERIADTVNYELVVNQAREIAEARHHDLVEDYADRLARACLEDPRVVSARVRVEKPEAFDAADAAGCEILLTRG